jgi:hypothetical protein
MWHEIFVHGFVELLMMRREFCLVLEAQKTTDATDIRNGRLVRSTTNAHEWLRRVESLKPLKR